jgi:hypothetical protein
MLGLHSRLHDGHPLAEALAQAQASGGEGQRARTAAQSFIALGA